MAKGDGSIQERSRGVWRVRVSWGVDPLTGKSIVKSQEVHGTKADARKVRDRMRQERESGLKACGASTIFSDFASEWLDSRKRSGRLAEKTVESNEYEVRALCSVLGGVKLPDVDARTVERALQMIKESRNVSNTTMRKIFVTLNQIMKRAVDFDLIMRNPCEKVKPPRLDRVERRALDVSEYAKLMCAVEDATAVEIRNFELKEERQEEWGADLRRKGLSGIRNVSNFVAVRIALATGMRLGEVLGLLWGAVSLSKGSLEVKTALTSRGKLKEPKSDSGHRVIALDPPTVAYLRQWRVFQSRQFIKVGVAVNDETPVCCSNSCGFVNVSNFEGWWREWADSQGFDGLKFHELRHTQATQLLAAGMDVKTVQGRLGHASASTTLDLYAHALPERDREAANIMARLANERKQDEKGRIIDLKAV